MSFVNNFRALYNIVMEWDRQKFIDTVARFIDHTAKRLPDDVVARLREMSDRETDERAKVMYACMLEDLDRADASSRPVCQDTGLVQFFVTVGSECKLLPLLPSALKEAVEIATSTAPLRPNAVEFPSENNTGTNTGKGVPFIEYDIVPGSDELRLTVYLQGGGSALPGRAAVFPPSVGFNGIAGFVADAMVEKGINACPPLVVGVGVAGCMATAAKLAKHAALRKIGVPSSDAEIAVLEGKLKVVLDEIAIGPQGVGGTSSVIAVNIDTACHHPSSMGVAVQFGCWAMRRGELIFGTDGVVCPTHGGFEV